jgi:hypothetical protein
MLAISVQLNYAWEPPMPDAELPPLARSMRARAEEIRTRAETFHDADARLKLHKIAVTYVKLAERLEQRARDADDADTV